MSYSSVPNTVSAPPSPGPSTPQMITGDSKGEIELGELGKPIAHYSDHEASAVHLAHERQPEQKTSYERLGGIVRNIWQTGFLPLVAFLYLGFCYLAATRVVPVRVWMVDEPARHLSTLKAGVTTINIIVIALALLPLKSLLDEIKGEEFFRILRVSRSGVPLKVINSVSTPSHTYLRGLISIFQNQASKYYVGAFLVGLMTTMISSLAPAALSVGVIHVDKDLTAFRVGSIASDSVIKTYYFGPNTNPNFRTVSTEAASMGWVQGVLNMSMSFQATSLKYGVPIPLDLEPTDRARYITDVIVMDPFCAWTVPNPPIVPPANLSNSSAEITAVFPDFGVTAQLLARDFQYDSLTGGGRSLDVLDEGFSEPLINISTGDPVTTGVMGWLMASCISCKRSSRFINITIDMSGIPSQEYHGVEKSNATEPQTTEFSFFMCDPRLTVETREVRLDGSGRIMVVEGGGLTRQGNLHLAQTRLLVGKSLMQFSSDSGPDMGFSGIGKAAQIRMFFGPLQAAHLTPVLTPRPIEELTQGYMIAQQAAMRSYLSGRLASSYVPGRVQEMKVVFTSSLPHVIVSTILFVLAAIFISVCHLRSDKEQFTLFSVAAVLAHSNFGRVCGALKYAGKGQGGLAEDVAIRSLGNRNLRLVNVGDGSGDALHME